MSQIFNFMREIHKMNETYELANYDTKNDFHDRMINFKAIIDKEYKELDDIVFPEEETLNSSNPEEYLRLRVMFADWLGDMTVYIFSEAERHGIPMWEILRVIMQSNFTKLGADGKPIKDENGKFLKGPNFQPPEPGIEAILRNS